MKVGTHLSIVGKPDSGADPPDGWETVDETWDDVFSLITDNGMMTTCVLRDGSGRNKANFAERQLIMVDIDNKPGSAAMTLADLQANTYYQQYGAGYYATRSHTNEQHRFRIMFITERPITCADDLEDVMRGLGIQYPAADEACKAAAQKFYGHAHCPEHLKEKTDRILPWREVERLKTLVPNVAADPTDIPSAGSPSGIPVAWSSASQPTETQICKRIAKRIAQMKDGDRFSLCQPIYGIIKHNWHILGSEAKHAIYSAYCQHDPDQARQKDIYNALHGRF